MHTRRGIAAAALLLAAAALPGCLLLAGAAVGAGIVHVTAEDRAVVDLEADPGTAYRTARDVIDDRGLLGTAKEDTRTVAGTIGGSSVEVRVDSRDGGGSRVTVEARRNAGVSPDVETAQQTASAILSRSR
jgi:hypothetical protein